MDVLRRTLADLQVIGQFLARRDLPSLDAACVGTPFDVLVLCGSGVRATVEVAAQAFHDGVAPHILVTGGIGHSTPYLAQAVAAHETWHDIPTVDRPEAAVIADVLRRHLGVPAAAITTEQRSTNCGENAELSLRLLPADGRVLLVQDPTMQRRTHAGFDHHQRLLGGRLEVVSQAPFVPQVRPHGVGSRDGGTAWSLGRFSSLVVGEVRRLHDDADGYGPQGAGFIDHVDVPDVVLAAYRRARTSSWLQVGDR